MSDYEIDYELPCPKCGNDFTHWRECLVWGCEDGYIWYSDYDDSQECRECHGTGIERWCPKCGTNIILVDNGEEAQP